MAEPTQGNPVPPNNQDGLMPPPTGAAKPEALSSASAEAVKAFDEFTEKLEEAKKKWDAQKKTLETQKTISDTLNKAVLNELKEREKARKSIENLNKETEKFKNSQGEWLENTQAQQEKYRLSVEEIEEAEIAAKDATQKATEELEKNTKTLREETNQRDAAINSLSCLTDVVKALEPTLEKDMGDAVKGLVDDIQSVELEAAKGITKSGKETDESKGELAKALAMETATENAKKEETTFDLKKSLDDIVNVKKQEEEAAAILSDLSNDQRVALSMVSEEVGTYEKEMEAAVALYKDKNKEATASDIKKFQQEFLFQKRSEIQNNINKKLEKELNDIREKKIRQIMEEKKVSRDAATSFYKKDADSQKEEQKLLDKQTDIANGIASMNSSILLGISQAKDSDIKAQEKEAEMKSNIPPWAQKFIDQVQLMRDGFSGIFKGNEGMFKKILLVLTIVIGAVLGYIWTKVQFIVGLLTHLPFGIGKAFGGIFKGIGGGFANLFKGAGELFAPVTKGLKPILGIFPGLSGSLGAFGKAFSFGFRILGKFFFYAQLVVDAIFGAYKGFQKLGDIRGMIIGAVAQIISGLTFGLLDFESIFTFLNDVFGTTIKGFVDMTVDLVMGFYNLAIKPFVDAIMNIVKIFQGGEGIFTKIFKSIYEMVFAGLKYMIGMLIFQFVKLPIYLMKAWFYVMKFIYWDMPMMLLDAIGWLWNWITSGKWLDDLLSFGQWLNDKFVDFFNWIIDSLADALGDIPIIGGYIKEAMGGGTKEEPLAKAVETSAEIIDDAQESQEAMAQASSGQVQFVDEETGIIPTPNGQVQFAPSAVPSYTATTVSQATARADTAKMSAAAPPTTAVNAPTTNNVVQGGGGGDTNMLSPTNNRNTEPTFRALLFQDCPAL